MPKDSNEQCQHPYTLERRTGVIHRLKTRQRITLHLKPDTVDEQHVVAQQLFVLQCCFHEQFTVGTTIHLRLDRPICLIQPAEAKNVTYLGERKVDFRRLDGQR